VQIEFSVEPVPAALPEQENLPAARENALEHPPEMKIAENLSLSHMTRSEVDKMGNSRGQRAGP
jgi:hypothetical protein